MKYLDVLIVAFFAFWALITIVGGMLRLLLNCYEADPPWMSILKPYRAKVVSWRRAVKSRDVLRLTSEWGFFSGNAGWFDLYIFVRGFRTDCTFTQWEDVTPKSRGGAVKLSYHTKRENRAVRSNARGLAYEPDQEFLYHDEPDQESSQVDEPDAVNPIILRIQYQFLLHYIRLRPFDPAVEWCQFLIATSKDNVPPRTGVTTPPDFTVPNRYVLFVSPFHKVNPQEASPSRSNTDSTNTDRRDREETPSAKQAVASSVNERYATAY